MKNAFLSSLMRVVCLCLCLFLINKTGAQTLQPTYGAPAMPVSVCNGNAVFKIKIIGSGSPCAEGTIDILLPAGYVYVGGSAKVSAGTGAVSQVSATVTTAQLKVTGIPALPDSTVISYEAYADCGAIGTATTTNSQAKYTLTSPCMGAYVVTSNTFNTQSAALSFTNITNSNYNGAVGDIYNREITITNNGLGAISQFTVKDTSGNGLAISFIGDFGTNMNFSSGNTGWKEAGCIPEVNAESVYGGSTSNLTAEIDNASCFAQRIHVTPGQTYQIRFNASRRTSNGTPATVGMTVAATGTTSNTDFFSQNYTYSNTTFGYTTTTATFTVPASATDDYVYLSFKPYNNTTTLGVIVDDVSFSPAMYAGWNIIHTKTASGTDTIHTYVISGAGLSQGQSITLTENVKIVNKCYLQTRLNAYFGCNGSICTTNNVSAAATAGATVNSSFAPSLKVITTGMSALICRGTPYAQTVAFANTGTAPLYNLDMDIFSSAWSSVAGTQYFNPARSYTGGGQSGYSNFRYKTGINGTWAPLPLTSTASFTTPGSAIVGLPSSVKINIPVINNGDTVYITYDELNSPLPAVNPSNTMEVSGGLLRYTYTEACGTGILPVAMFLRNYQQVRINTLSTVPANMELGNLYDFSYTFSEANSGVYIYTGATGSHVRFELVLPGKIDFSGNASDVTLIKNGTPYGSPAGFAYNAGTKTVTITYPVSGAFTVNGMQGATLTFKNLSLNCAAAGNDNKAILKTYVKAMTTCANEEQMPAVTNSIGFVCPEACGVNGGMSFNGFSFKRVNYGLPDNNNDGVADGAGAIDMSKVRTNYAMIGDTVEAAFYGRINVGAPLAPNGLRFGYAVDTFSAYSTYFTNLYATVQLYASGNATPFYTCNNVPISGGTTNTRKVDFSIDALNNISGCALPPGYTKYNNGDSAVVKIYYRVATNPGATLVPLTIANKFLVSNVANPGAAQQYSCGGKYSSNLTLVGWGGGASGTVIYNITGDAVAATAATNTAMLGPCCVNAGSKPFVYEYRSVTIYDSAWYVMPAGYDFVSASVYYVYTKGPSATAAKTVAIAPVDPLAGTLVFNIKALFENGSLPYGDQGSYITLTVNVRANCNAPARTAARFNVRQVATPGSGFTLTPFSPTVYDSLYLTAADIIAAAANNTITTNTNTVSWDVQLSNATIATAKNVWIAKDIDPGGVTITSIQRLSGPAGTVVATIAPSGGGIYQLGNFAQVSNYYRINATYTNCIKDSITMAYGFDCSSSGYPSSITAAASKKTIGLYVIPQQAALQLGIISQPDPLITHNFCDVLDYTLEAYNAGPGSVSNNKITVQLPAAGGLSYIPGSLYFEFPAGSGSYISLHDSCVATSGTQLICSIPAAILAKLDAMQGFRLRIGLEANCNFASGQTVRFTPSGTTPCGQTTSGITQQSEKIQMAGVPANTNLYGITSAADTAAQACVPTGEIAAQYRFKIVNQGPLPTSSSDIFSIELPSPWELDTTSVTYLHNPNGAVYWQSSGSVFYFKTGVGVVAGDSVVLTATLRVKAPQAATVPTGLTPLITENAIVLYSGFCSSTGLSCPSSQVIVSSNQTTAIPVASPAYSIKAFSIQQNTSKDTGLIGTLRIVHTNTLYTPHDVTIKVYKDVNNNNAFDAGDLLLGQQTFPVLNNASQTFIYNINSPYTGNLCPSLVAVADFGCYAATASYNCSSATAVYSNGGTAKTISQCDNNTFSLAAADASGKWVLDSGAAVIAAPHAVNTTATVNAGDKARLLWFAYTTDTTKNIIVYPDTIRLINNAKPVIVPLNDTAVCQGNTLSVTASASVVNAVLTYQWAKNGADIPGATSATLLVSNNMQATDAGKYTLTVTGGDGCATKDSLNVTVDLLPTATISYPNALYCTTGTAVVTQTGQGGGTYSSTTGLVIDAATGEIDLGASTAGVYTVTYSFTDGTCPNTTTADITINQQPAVAITDPAAVCMPNTVDLTTASVTTGSTTGLNYTYFTDAAGTATLSNPNAVATSGTYYIKGTTAAGCSDIQPVTVTINPLPVASISYSGSPFCATGTAVVIQTGQTGGTYSSTTGLSVDAATGEINLATSTAGTYIVTYTFTDGTCSNTDTAHVVINPVPNVVITSPAAVCSPNTVNITVAAVTAGSTSGLTYTYFTDAAGTTSLSDPNAVAASGTYYIKGTTAAGCTDIKPVVVVINPLPVATISYSGTPFCATGTATVTQTGQTGGTYSSTTGLSINSATGAINLSASTAGTYTVTYTFTDGTCSNTTTASVTINALPTVAVTDPAAICSPSTVDITAAAITTGSTPGLTYTYFTNAAGTTVLSNPNSISTGGTYYIKGTTASGCTDIRPVVVTINPEPTVVVTDPAAVCAPGAVNITNSAVTTGSTAGLSYTYFTDVAATITLSNPSALTTSGTYYIKGTTAAGCSDVQPVNVVVDIMPTASISYNGGPYCATGTATVTQTGYAGGTYSSAAGLSINATTGAIDLGMSTPGQYTVVYTFTSGACTGSANTIINIGTPTLVITNPAAVCAPGTVNITAGAVTAGSAGDLTYSYYTDAAGTASLSNPAAVGTSNTYYIKGVDSRGCPTLVEPVSVTINPQPALSLSADKTLVCKWEEVNLSATSAGSTIVWENNHNGNAYTAYPSANTSYTAVATDALGCKTTDHINISVRDFKAALTATPNPVMSGTTVTLTPSANTGFDVIAWMPAQYFPGQQANAQTITITDSSKTFYTILQSPDGCRDTANVRVNVEDNTRELFIPNAFTPNHDGKNDIFKVYGTSVKSIEMRIYNQWGNLLYETKDNNKGWDGTYKGKQQPVGIYLYAIKIYLYNNSSIIRNGTISLIR
ncbi:MAG: gliding motility-associated C-terminal domain-containing protein [Chitinophagaceae bacterium]|nr:gliding motility-associated C-terminal domain-containing protein [Chitinophagaceae bacterium]